MEILIALGVLTAAGVAAWEFAVQRPQRQRLNEQRASETWRRIAREYALDYSDVVDDPSVRQSTSMDRVMEGTIDGIPLHLGCRGGAHPRTEVALTLVPPLPVDVELSAGRISVSYHDPDSHFPTGDARFDDRFITTGKDTRAVCTLLDGPTRSCLLDALALLGDAHVTPNMVRFSDNALVYEGRELTGLITALLDLAFALRDAGQRIDHGVPLLTDVTQHPA